MPSVQAYQLVQDISIDLYEKYLPRFLSNDDNDDKSKPPNKRRKLDLKGCYDNKSPVRKHIMEPLITFINRFLRSIKIAPTFKDDMAKISQTLFDRFVYVILTSPLSEISNNNRNNSNFNGSSNNNEPTKASLVYSALSLHYTLIELSYDYWKKLSVTEFSPIYNDILDNISVEHPAVMLYLVRFFFLKKEKARHLYCFLFFDLEK